MNRSRMFRLVVSLLWVGGISAGLPLSVRAVEEPARQAAFEAARRLPAKLIFAEPGTGGWRARWSLDGQVGYVKTGSEGLDLHAGPEPRNNAHHVVLWTRRDFEGDVRIEYDYTRLDEATKFVNILYLFASGSGEPPYLEDIRAWAGLRKEPAMFLYFRHMNLYHISYAAFGNPDDPTDDYVRARRYRPDREEGLTNTELEPDYQQTGLFATGVPHHITVIRRGDDLFFHVRNPEQERLFHWSIAGQPPLGSGPIGLRHMHGRAARYENFEVHQILPAD